MWRCIPSAAREHTLLTEIEAERDRAALRESQAQVASFFEQAAAGITQFDATGRLIRVNPRYCQILGRPREELIGQQIHSFISPDDLEASVLGLNITVRTGEAFEIDPPLSPARWLHCMGVSTTVNLIRTVGSAGKAAGSILAVVLDIIERKKIEEELRQTNRRKDEFLVMLAHELRNPLAPISTAAEIIRLARLDEARLKQTSEVILRQVRHMTDLIDDLLDVSRVTRGLIVINKSLRDIKSIVATAVEQVHPLIEKRQHHLSVELAPESSCLWVDEKRMVQVLVNILSNAAKYTPSGGQIQLRTKVYDDHINLEHSR